ncbi:MAG TPA: TolC family protein [Flavobacterium sp.]|jgi:outer membrane protein TolC
MKTLLVLLLVCSANLSAQKQTILPFADYISMVKQNHPLVKNANLQPDKAKAEITSARGAFDPRLEASHSEKQFGDYQYYLIQEGALKVSTWYGIEFKAGFENSSGAFLNPENKLPENGLLSAGINVPIGQGLFINKRMTDLKNAKLQLSMSQSERILQAAAVLYDASATYFNWHRAYLESALYNQYVVAAEKRQKGIATMVIAGERPAMDSIEAGIVLKNRILSLEEAKLKVIKARLELSVFLWNDNNAPLEVTEQTFPEQLLPENVSSVLQTAPITDDSYNIDNHPKINLMRDKLGILENHRRLKANEFLPKAGVGYSYLTEYGSTVSGNLQDYKIGLHFSYPVFLRKERGEVRLAKLKLREAAYELESERLQLKNQISAYTEEIKSLKKQLELATDVVRDYDLLLRSEERLFSFGESSLFVLNTRENNFIMSEISKLSLENRVHLAHAQLFKALASTNAVQ